MTLNFNLMRDVSRENRNKFRQTIAAKFIYKITSGIFAMINGERLIFCDEELFIEYYMKNGH